MRRLTSYIGIILLSLLVSGWSDAFAATFCPHSAGKNLTAMMKGMDVPSCHRENAEQASSSRSHSQAMDDMEMMPAAEQENQVEIIPVSQFTGRCSHCVGQEKVPAAAATVRELSLQKRDVGAPINNSGGPLVTLNNAFFSPTSIYRQNAPPGMAGPKHLLLGVFLI